jgi:hypothetical protein
MMGNWKETDSAPVVGIDKKGESINGRKEGL